VGRRRGTTSAVGGVGGEENESGAKEENESGAEEES
jgi:hypothetical protein